MATETVYVNGIRFDYVDIYIDLHCLIIETPFNSRIPISLQRIQQISFHNPVHDFKKRDAGLIWECPFHTYPSKKRSVL